MKTFVKTLLFCAVIALCTSCKKADELRSEPEPRVDEEIAIIKISPEMLDYVFVSPILDSIKEKMTFDSVGNKMRYENTEVILYYADSLALYTITERRKELAECVKSSIDIIGKNPYILLKNGYVIIDWKWTHFHPLSGASIEPLYYSYDFKNHFRDFYTTNHNYYNGSANNEEYYIIPTKWNEISDLSQKWGKNEGVLVEKPEVRWIKVKRFQEYRDLMKQKGTKFKCDDVPERDIWERYSYLRESFPINFCNYFDDEANVEKQNKLQDYCIETLNLMIENNDFETWTHDFN